MPKLTRAQQHEVLIGDEPSAPERREGALLDAAVRQGQAAGEFADLPGKGRPLTFRPEEGLAMLDENWLANHLLRNAAYVPPWAQVGQALEAARRTSQQAVEAWRGAPDDPARAAAVTSAWEAENALVRRWNAQVPNPTLQGYPMPVERRWARLRGAAGAAEASANPAPREYPEPEALGAQGSRAGAGRPSTPPEVLA